MQVQPSDFNLTNSIITVKIVSGKGGDFLSSRATHTIFCYALYHGPHQCSRGNSSNAIVVAPKSVFYTKKSSINHFFMVQLKDGFYDTLILYRKQRLQEILPKR